MARSYTPTVRTATRYITPTATTPPRLTPPKSSTNIGAIVGGAVGGAVVLLAVVALILLRLRKKKKTKAEAAAAAATHAPQNMQGYMPHSEMNTPARELPTTPPSWQSQRKQSAASYYPSPGVYHQEMTGPLPSLGGVSPPGRADPAELFAGAPWSAVQHQRTDLGDQRHEMS